MLEHPSPEIRFPSSHASLDALRLSPHVDWQTEGFVPEQLNPNSTIQMLEHPSPESVFPSSHPSSEAFKSSPHVDVHI